MAMETDECTTATKDGGGGGGGDVLLKALEALKKASKEVEANPGGGDDSEDGGGSGSHSSSMKALLELETSSDDLFGGDPRLSSLSCLLSRLKSLVISLGSNINGGSGSGSEGAGGGLLRSILRRRCGSHTEISRVAGSIASEIQTWIDRESTERLVTVLRSPASAGADDEEAERLLAALEDRASRGFDRELQEVLLGSGAFAAVESAMADASTPKRVRERAAAAALALVRFNKAVFVGPMLMGPAVGALACMSTPAALRALRGLVTAIRSPLVDELLARGLIPGLVALLSPGAGGIVADDRLEIRVLALGWAMEMAYYGRKEAVEAMIAEGVVKRLVSLQRSEMGGALIEMDDWDGDDGEEGIRAVSVRRSEGGDSLEAAARPFASCVARWAIQVEVGEGLRRSERRALKRVIIERAKEAAADEAEAATLLAEVLWGSTTW